MDITSASYQNSEIAHIKKTDNNSSTAKNVKNKITYNIKIFF